MQRAWYPTPESVGITVLAVLLASLGIVSCLAAYRSHLGSVWWQPRSVQLAGAAGLAPALVRAAMPWEEPGSGYGSPMAVLIGVVMLACLGFVSVTLPLLMLGKRKPSFDIE